MPIFKIFKKAKLKEGTAEREPARELIEYVLKLISRKDMINTQLKELKKADSLPKQEREKVYFFIYLELEKFIVEHLPPAVKKKLNREKLKHEIKKRIDIKTLSEDFQILFLEKEQKVAELFIIVCEKFVKRILPLWKPPKLKKFIKEFTKGTNLTIDTDKEISFKKLHQKIIDSSEEEISYFTPSLSSFLSILYKRSLSVIGEDKTKNSFTPVYQEIKEKYGLLPLFSDFLRATSEVLEEEKKILLAPRASESIAVNMAEILKEEGFKISSQLQDIEKARKLPLENRTKEFFNIYFELEKMVTGSRLSLKRKRLEMSNLKKEIREKVNVEDLEDRFQVLFLREEELLVKLVKGFIRECITNFIEKKALVEAERELIKKSRILSGVIIDDEGVFNLKPLLININKLQTNRLKELQSALSNIILACYKEVKAILGELQAKKIFEEAYATLQQKYGVYLLQILKFVPKGVLSAERFELMSYEEAAKVGKELVKVERLKGEFMDIAAHELKTPLVPIIGYLEMLLDGKNLNKDQRDKMRLALSAARREKDLVDDILDISKIDSGTMKFEFDVVQPSQIIRDCAESLRPFAKQKGISLVVQVPAKLPPIKADARRISQVVTNFANNAIKFTEKGSVTVKAHLMGGQIRVAVTDTGIGISSENVKKLFTKFFQADTSARRKYGGTGLGLAISKGIIESHGGKVSVESVLGKGTTFSFVIPILTEKTKKIKRE
jgi:signal transduction histidine kinase